MDFLLVGIGGILGSLARYVVGKRISSRCKSVFPFGTMIANITGAILLGIVISLQADRNLLLLLADGFLGAYTTFSTLMYEGFKLFTDKKTINACTYIGLSFLFGILGFAAGLYLTHVAIFVGFF